MRSAATPLVLALAMIAGQASAQEGGLAHMWPKAGAWVTTLTTLPNGHAVCSSSTGPQNTGTGQEDASFGFDIDDQETHFHLRLRGAAPLDPPSLQMEVAGSVLVRMPVIQRLDKDGGQDIVADIVGDRFVLLVEPRLVGKAAIVIRAADRTYVLPHEDFVRTIDNLSACAKEARQPDALPLR